MGRRIKLITRRELTVAIRLRYGAADRNSKKIILDEFVKVTYARRCKTRPQCAARAVLRGGVKAGHRRILVL
jgi:hypothetical protein